MYLLYLVLKCYHLFKFFIHRSWSDTPVTLDHRISSCFYQGVKTELKTQIGHRKELKGDVSSVSPSSERYNRSNEGLTLEG